MFVFARIQENIFFDSNKTYQRRIRPKGYIDFVLGLCPSNDDRFDRETNFPVVADVVSFVLLADSENGF